MGEIAQSLRLMVVTDPQCGPGRTVPEVVSQAIAGGATAIQLRMKEASAREMMAAGRSLRTITREAGILFLVNDRLDVALCLEADGVHLGEDDLPVDAARSIAPTGFIVGYSADSAVTAREGEVGGADYLGVGPIYPTGTKPDAGAAVGPERIRQIAAATGLPMVGIGGIGPGRAQAVVDAGAAGIAVVSGIMESHDPREAASALLREMAGES